MLFAGNTYTVQLVIQYRGYGYYGNNYGCNAYSPPGYIYYSAMHRVFMDWGMDGSFNEEGNPADDWVNGDVRADWLQSYSDIFPLYYLFDYPGSLVR